MLALALQLLLVVPTFVLSGVVLGPPQCTAVEYWDPPYFCPTPTGDTLNQIDYTVYSLGSAKPIFGCNFVEAGPCSWSLSTGLPYDAEYCPQNATGPSATTCGHRCPMTRTDGLSLQWTMDTIGLISCFYNDSGLRCIYDINGALVQGDSSCRAGWNSCNGS
ncbi:hypothetical protein BKA62DRAFT_788480 [Auriculariales sp. MPI-PUGE-AT-0066]|nr:hypothetical protein BKA62DRAFT_788480 [Auriculariales sp. MPI-PUGE-AT-0066]